MKLSSLLLLSVAMVSPVLGSENNDEERDTAAQPASSHTVSFVPAVPGGDTPVSVSRQNSPSSSSLPSLLPQQRSEAPSPSPHAPGPDPEATASLSAAQDLTASVAAPVAVPAPITDQLAATDSVADAPAASPLSAADPQSPSSPAISVAEVTFTPSAPLLGPRSSSPAAPEPSVTNGAISRTFHATQGFDPSTQGFDPSTQVDPVTGQATTLTRRFLPPGPPPPLGLGERVPHPLSGEPLFGGGASSSDPAPAGGLDGGSSSGSSASSDGSTVSVGLVRSRRSGEGPWHGMAPEGTPGGGSPSGGLSHLSSQHSQGPASPAPVVPNTSPSQPLAPAAPQPSNMVGYAFLGPERQETGSGGGSSQPSALSSRFPSMLGFPAPGQPLASYCASPFGPTRGVQATPAPHSLGRSAGGSSASSSSGFGGSRDFDRVGYDTSSADPHPPSSARPLPPSYPAFSLSASAQASSVSYGGGSGSGGGGGGGELQHASSHPQEPVALDAAQVTPCLRALPLGVLYHCSVIGAWVRVRDDGVLVRLPRKPDARGTRGVTEVDINNRVVIHLPVPDLPAVITWWSTIPFSPTSLDEDRKGPLATVESLQTVLRFCRGGGVDLSTLFSRPRPRAHAADCLYDLLPLFALCQRFVPGHSLTALIQRGVLRAQPTRYPGSVPLYEIVQTDELEYDPTARVFIGYPPSRVPVPVSIETIDRLRDALCADDRIQSPPSSQAAAPPQRALPYFGASYGTSTGAPVPYPAAPVAAAWPHHAPYHPACGAPGGVWSHPAASPYPSSWGAAMGAPASASYPAPAAVAWPYPAQPSYPYAAPAVGPASASAPGGHYPPSAPLPHSSSGGAAHSLLPQLVETGLLPGGVPTAPHHPLGGASSGGQGASSAAGQNRQGTPYDWNPHHPGTGPTPPHN